MNHALVWKGLPVCFRIGCCWHNTAKILCCPCSLIIRSNRERQDSVSEFWQWVGGCAHTGCRICKRQASILLITDARQDVNRKAQWKTAEWFLLFKKKDGKRISSDPEWPLSLCKGLTCPKRAAGRKCPLSPAWSLNIKSFRKAP